MNLIAIKVGTCISKQYGPPFVPFRPDNVLKVVSKQQLEVDKWTYITITYDGRGKAQGVKIFIDGKPCEIYVEHDSLSKPIVNEVPLR